MLVNPARLRTAEMTALTSKKPAHYLLNKVLDMVFTKDELVEAKGVKSLNQHKLDAIKGKLDLIDLIEILYLKT